MVRQDEIAEQIRRSAVSRTLERMELSSEEEEAIERMSHSLVDRVLHDLLCPLRLWGRANNKGEEISF